MITGRFCIYAETPCYCYCHNSDTPAVKTIRSSFLHHGKMIFMERYKQHIPA